MTTDNVKIVMLIGDQDAPLVHQLAVHHVLEFKIKLHLLVMMENVIHVSMYRILV